MSTYYFLPTRNVFGEGAVQEAGDLVKSLGAKKCLIVTDRYLGQIGMADRVQGILEKAGIEACIFAGAEPNPTDKNVEAGPGFIRKMNAIPSFPWAAVLPMTVQKVLGWLLPMAGRLLILRGLISLQNQ